MTIINPLNIDHNPRKYILQILAYPAHHYSNDIHNATTSHAFISKAQIGCGRASHMGFYIVLINNKAVYSHYDLQQL